MEATHNIYFPGSRHTDVGPPGYSSIWQSSLIHQRLDPFQRIRSAKTIFTMTLLAIRPQEGRKIILLCFDTFGIHLPGYIVMGIVTVTNVNVSFKRYDTLCLN